jgi:hypothetical protein
MDQRISIELIAGPFLRAGSRPAGYQVHWRSPRHALLALLTTIKSPKTRMRNASLAGAIAWSSTHTNSSSICR